MEKIKITDFRKLKTEELKTANFLVIKSDLDGNTEDMFRIIGVDAPEEEPPKKVDTGPTKFVNASDPRSTSFTNE